MAGIDFDSLRKKLLNSGTEASEVDKIITSIKTGLSDAAKKASNSSSSSSSSGIGTNVLNSLADTAAAGFYDRYENAQARISVETAKKIFGKISDIPSLNPLTMLKGILDAGLSGAEAGLKDLAKVNDQLIEKTKGAAGYVGQIGDSMMEGLHEAMIATTALGITVNDFLEATESLMVNSERMAMYSESTIYAGMEASMAYTKSSRTLLENAESFRNVGLGLYDTSKAVESIGKRSISLGLSAKATSETLVKNVDKLNLYGFKNGIDGLGKMVQEAQALKINMDEVFKVADKVMDPEGAISMAANLQVLGGAYGDLNDPIKLMYDSTNNVESLQTSILGAARSLATYNTEQGRFEVTGANLRRAKAMADALGVSMGELTNMAVKGAAKMEAMSQLDMFPNLTDTQREFVSNIATMKNGRVGFDLPKDMAKKLGITNLVDGFVSIDQLGSEQISALQKIQEDNEKMSTKDIARSQLNATTQTLSVVSSIYLRMMEDTRTSSLGKTIRENTQKGSDFLYQNFDASKMSTRDMLNFGLKMAKDSVRENATEIYNSMIESFPEVDNVLKSTTEKIKNAVNSPEVDKMKETVKPYIDKGVDWVKDKLTAQMDIKVDLNSSSTELAQMFVNEINRNPQLRTDLASSLSKGMKNYVA